MKQRNSSHLNSILIFQFLLLLAIDFVSANEMKTFKIYFENNKQWNDIKTDIQYFTLLNTANKTIFQFEFEAEFLLLLTDVQKEQYNIITSMRERKAYIKKYWILSNPNPLLSQNDRLLDHLRRRAYARNNFPTDEPPYFDDRGKYYIKYGKPMFRYQDYGGQRSMESRLSIPFKYYSVRPNESWSYVNISPGYVVHFMQSNNGFKEIESLKEVIIDSQRRNRQAWYWFDLLKNRFWLSSRVTEVVIDIEQLETDVFIANQGIRSTIDRVGSPATRLSDKMIRNLRQAEYEINLARLDVPAVTYDPIHARNKIPFTGNVAQFRGSNGQTRVEIAILSPLRYYINRKNPIQFEVINAEFSSMMRNNKLDELTSSQVQIEFPAKLAVEENVPNVIGFMRLQVPPQSGELAFQVTNKKNNKIGFAHENIILRDFENDKLMMSDIQLFMEVKDSSQIQVLPVIEKQGLLLSPYPFEKIQKSLPLMCYFEIYNLHPQQYGNEYELTIRVYKDKNRRSQINKLLNKLQGKQEESLSITNTRQFDSETAREFGNLELSNLLNGNYILEISVQYNKESSEIVLAQKDITIVD